MNEIGDEKMPVLIIKENPAIIKKATSDTAIERIGEPTRYQPSKLLAVRDLNTNTSKDTAGVWQICCKVSKKHPIKVHANGQLFKVDFTDDQDSQTMIEGTFYTEETDKFYPILEEGKKYLISNVEVSIANKRFTSIKNDFRLIFPMNSKIEEVSEIKP